MEQFLKFIDTPIDAEGKKQLLQFIQSRQASVLSIIISDIRFLKALYVITEQLIPQPEDATLALTCLQVVAQAYDDARMRGVINSVTALTSPFITAELIQLLQNSQVSQETTVALFAQYSVMTKPTQSLAGLMSKLAPALQPPAQKQAQAHMKEAATRMNLQDRTTAQEFVQAFASTQPDIDDLSWVIAACNYGLLHQVQFDRTIKFTPPKPAPVSHKEVLGEVETDLFNNYKHWIEDAPTGGIVTAFLERLFTEIKQQEPKIIEYYSKYSANVTVSTVDGELVLKHPLKFAGGLGPFPHVMSPAVVACLKSFDKRQLFITVVWYLNSTEERSVAQYLQLLAIVFSQTGWFYNELEPCQEDWGSVEQQLDSIDYKQIAFQIPRRQVTIMDVLKLRKTIFVSLQLFLQSKCQAKIQAFCIFSEIFVKIMVTRPSLVQFVLLVIKQAPDEVLPQLYNSTFFHALLIYFDAAHASRVPPPHKAIAEVVTVEVLQIFRSAIIAGSFQSFLDNGVIQEILRAMTQYKLVSDLQLFLQAIFDKMEMSLVPELFKVMNNVNIDAIISYMLDMKQSVKHIAIYQLLSQSDLSDALLEKIQRIKIISERHIQQLERIHVGNNSILYVEGSKCVRQPFLAFKILFEAKSDDGESLAAALKTPENLHWVEYLGSHHLSLLDKMRKKYTPIGTSRVVQLIAAAALLNPGLLAEIRQAHIPELSDETLLKLFQEFLQTDYKYLTATSFTMQKAKINIDPGYTNIQLDLVVHGRGMCGVFAVVNFTSGEILELEFNDFLQVKVPTKMFAAKDESQITIKLQQIGKNQILTINKNQHKLGSKQQLHGDIASVEFNSFSPQLNVCLTQLTVEKSDSTQQASFDRYNRQPPFKAVFDYTDMKQKYYISDIAQQLEGMLIQNLLIHPIATQSIIEFLMEHDALHTNLLARTMHTHMIQSCDSVVSSVMKLDQDNIKNFVFNLKKCIGANVMQIQQFVSDIEKNDSTLKVYMRSNPQHFPSLIADIFSDSMDEIQNEDSLVFAIQTTINLCYVEEIVPYLNATFQRLFVVSQHSKCKAYYILVNEFVRRFEKQLDFSQLLVLAQSEQQIKPISDALTLINEENGNLNALFNKSMEQSQIKATKQLISCTFLAFVASEINQPKLCKAMEEVTCFSLLQECEQLQLIDFIFLSLIAKTKVMQVMTTSLQQCISDAKQKQKSFNTQPANNILNYMRYSMLMEQPNLNESEVEIVLNQISESQLSTDVPFVVQLVSTLSCTYQNPKLKSLLQNHLQVVFQQTSETSSYEKTSEYLSKLLSYNSVAIADYVPTFSANYTPFALSVFFESEKNGFLIKNRFKELVINGRSKDFILLNELISGEQQNNEFILQNDKFMELAVRYKYHLLPTIDNWSTSFMRSYLIQERARIETIKERIPFTINVLRLFLFSEFMQGFNFAFGVIPAMDKYLDQKLFDSMAKFEITYPQVSATVPFRLQMTNLRTVQSITDLFALETMNGIKTRLAFHRVVSVQAVFDLQQLLPAQVKLPDKLCDAIKQCNDYDSFLVCPDKAQLKPEEVDFSENGRLLLLFIALLLLFEQRNDQQTRLYVACTMQRISKIYDSALSTLKFGLDESMSQFLKKIRQAKTYSETALVMSCSSGVPKIIYDSVKNLFNALEWDFKGYDKDQGFICKRVELVEKQSPTLAEHLRKVDEMVLIEHYIDNGKDGIALEAVDDCEVKIGRKCSKGKIMLTSKLYLYYDNRIEIIEEKEISHVARGQDSYAIHMVNYRVISIKCANADLVKFLAKKQQSKLQDDNLVLQMITDWISGKVTNLLFITRMNILAGVTPSVYPTLIVGEASPQSTVFFQQPTDLVHISDLPPKIRDFRLPAVEVTLNEFSSSAELIEYIYLLQSPFVSQNLHIWVDWTFGEGHRLDYVTPIIQSNCPQRNMLQEEVRVPANVEYKFIADSYIQAGGAVFDRRGIPVCSAKEGLFAHNGLWHLAMDEDPEFMVMASANNKQKVKTPVFKNRFQNWRVFGSKIYFYDAQGVFVHQLPGFELVYWVRVEGVVGVQNFFLDSEYIFVTTEGQTLVYQGVDLIEKVDKIMTPNALMTKDYHKVEETGNLIFDVREKLIEHIATNVDGFVSLNQGQVVQGLVEWK